jgi:hypothetical protein
LSGSQNLLQRADTFSAPLVLDDQTKGVAVARVLVSEEIAETGLEELRNAGHDVDVRLGMSPKN